MSAQRLLGTVLAGATLVAASSGAAAGFATIAEQAPGPLLTSGGRYAGFLVADRTIRVLDTFTAGSYDAAIPASCADPVTLAAVGGDQALVSCANRLEIGSEGLPTLLDLPSGAWHEPVGAATFLRHEREGDNSARFDAVGVRWLAGTVTGYHSYARTFLDWRTGTSVVGDGDAFHQPDLDAAEVLAPLCPPLKRRHNPESIDEQPFFDFPYEPPYGIVGRRLRTCGASDHGLLLDRAPAGGFRVSDGWVTWSTGQQARAYLPSCGVRFSWPLLGADGQPHGGEVSHTARTLFVGIAAHDGPRPGPFRILARARPDCPPQADRLAVQVTGSSGLTPARLVAARWPTRLDGSPKLLRVPHGAAPVLKRRAAPAAILTRVPVARVRWRVSLGPWRTLTGRRRLWRIGHVAAGPLTISVRYLDGATARFRLTLR